MEQFLAWLSPWVNVLPLEMLLCAVSLTCFAHWIVSLLYSSNSSLNKSIHEYYNFQRKVNVIITFSFFVSFFFFFFALHRNEVFVNFIFK